MQLLAIGTIRRSRGARIPGSRRTPVWRRQRAQGEAASRLAPWQERRAKELLLAHLEGQISLADVARACGLSRGYFLKAFHQTTGLPPYRWLVSQRIERAKEYLRDAQTPFSAISQACGFADQSHFTRTLRGSRA
ncbi:AraC family transcriptional regulator [Paraburkholderia sp. CNPSo 3272]|uniref:helix-turn-helix transcriptional regulator n=1 Tax=Paraburkholderia sp. CNPSo 3272 TaxID=2940931 RepID=UPI0020B8D237|nr:AraC family transcriptional regulator [Paraburkholderia sp. CNPSo 3272]MCP3724277.1 AraC family transcriptional regulator [Paraburkholderia sp. CNPSo 3272]